eukprot:10957343-Lingulodinium_polyedra.AAC.1
MCSVPGRSQSLGVAAPQKQQLSVVEARAQQCALASQCAPRVCGHRFPGVAAVRFFATLIVP